MKLIWHRKFKDWRSDDVEKTFDLSLSGSSEALQAWRQSQSAVPDELRQWLEDRRAELQRLQFAWNEQELMARFIGPILTSIGFLGQHFNLFHQRQLTLTYQHLKTSGAVDGMVASGIYEPECPYFFLQEYKKSQGYDSDPFGQLLIAMIAAQQLNADGKAMYGCFVIGKYWSFILLDGQQYAMTQGYDATDAGELQIIWSMLVEVKRIVEDRVAQLMAETD